MRSITTILFLFFISTIVSADLPEKPNVVFIVMDDFDILDMKKFKEEFNQPHDSYEIQTPELDDFFDKSLVFTNFHTNGANCSPTRGSLLTGLFPSDLGYYRAVPHYSERGIPEDSLVISEILGQNDYVAGTIGKWNVGHKGDSNFLNPEVFTPTGKSFDYSLCTVGCNIDKSSSANSPVTQTNPDTTNDWGMHEYSRYEDKRAKTDNTIALIDFKSIGLIPHAESEINSSTYVDNYDENAYMTKQLTDDALSFIDARVVSSETFFLNLWYWLPHGPNHVPLGIIEDANQTSPNNRYLKYRSYALRNDYPPFYIGSNNEIAEMSDVDSCPYDTMNTNPLDDYDNLSCNTELGEYAAMVTRLDEAIGRVIDKAMATPNTLIIIVSDNGGAANGQHVLRDREVSNFGINENHTFKGSKNEMYERGLVAPMMIRWSGSTANTDILNHAVIDDLVLSRETYATLAKLADVQLPNAPKFGADFTHLLKNHHNDPNTASESVEYINNFRSEWLMSEHRPVFYENNVDNHPHITYVDSSLVTQCNGSNIDTRGEYQHFATHQHLWKHVYHSNYWNSHGNYSSCTSHTSELFKVAGTPNPASNPVQIQYEMVDESSTNMHVVKYLELLRKRWQQGIGVIDFNYEQIGGSASEDNNGHINITGTNGYVSLGESERYNSADGNFTFSTVITPSDCLNMSGKIAEREDSWLLEALNGQLKLKVYASELGEVAATTDTYSLDSDNHLLSCQTKNHVAFSILGGRKGGPLVRLFLNGSRVDTKIRVDGNAVALPNPNPDNQWLNSSINTSLVVNSGNEITLGTALSGSSFLANIQRPKMYITAFSNEDMLFQDADSLNQESYENSNITYTIDLNDQNTTPSPNGANFSNPEYEFSPANPLPVNGENAVVKLDRLAASFGASPNNEYSFSAVIDFDEDQPYDNSVIAKQTADPFTGSTSASWILKLKEYTLQGGPQYQLKLNIIGDDGADNLCANKTLAADVSEYLSLDSGPTQVGFNVSHGKVRLFLDNQIIDSQDFDDGTNPCFVAQGKHLLLGNKYENCQTQVANNPADPVSKYCQVFDGIIKQVEVYPTPHYSTVITGNVEARSDVLSFSTNASPSPNSYPYAILTGDFDAVNDEYHFATVANLLADSIGTHATLGRQTHNGDSASWILKYAHDDNGYPSEQFKLVLNVWFNGASNSLKLDPDEIINPYEEHHIAFSIYENQAILYLDGEEIMTKTCAEEGLTCNGFVGGDQITFGAQKATPCDSAGSTCHPFPGYLYIPRIWTSDQTDENFMRWDARYNHKF